jgi:hypothetical protein
MGECTRNFLVRFPLSGKTEMTAPVTHVNKAGSPALAVVPCLSDAATSAPGVLPRGLGHGGVPQHQLTDWQGVEALTCHPRLTAAPLSSHGEEDDMTEFSSQVLLYVAAAGKLWNSDCQQTMTVDRSELGPAVYRCASPCGQHTASVDKVKEGLLWHYRGRRVDATYGMPDDLIVEEMLIALHAGWVRNGKIYTAQFH